MPGKLKTGDELPDIEMMDGDGATGSLHSRLGGSLTVLTLLRSFT